MWWLWIRAMDWPAKEEVWFRLDRRWKTIGQKWLWPDVWGQSSNKITLVSNILRSAKFHWRNKYEVVLWRCSSAWPIWTHLASLKVGCACSRHYVFKISEGCNTAVMFVSFCICGDRFPVPFTMFYHHWKIQLTSRPNQNVVISQDTSIMVLINWAMPNIRGRDSGAKPPFWFVRCC